MPSPSPSKPSRDQIALAKITEALGFQPETAATEWLEAIADVISEDASIASAIRTAYCVRDEIGWGKPPNMSKAQYDAIRASDRETVEEIRRQGKNPYDYRKKR